MKTFAVQVSQYRRVAFFVCPLCKVPTLGEDCFDHLKWHEVNNSHGVDCAWAKGALAQRETSNYLIPQPCTCSVILEKAIKELENERM